MYYLATPLFAALDLLVGVSIRAAGIASTGWRLAYYAFAFGCWLALRYRPRWTPAIGIGESSINLLILLLSVLGPIFAAPLIVAEGGDLGFSFGVGRMLNVLLAGSVLIFAFHGHQTDLARQLGLGATDSGQDGGDRGRDIDES